VTRDELYDIHADMGDDALEIMRAKNVDYASEADPFRNFRTFGLLGIVVRMSDKIARLHSLVERGLENNAVKDESYRDTLLDLVNYSVIFAAMAQEASPVRTSPAPPSFDDILGLGPDDVCPPDCAECMGPDPWPGLVYIQADSL
jgi:hypothetical protein